MTSFRSPPVETRFQKGNREHLKRKKKRSNTDFKNSLRRFLLEPVEYRERRKVKRDTRINVLIKKLISLAMNGDEQAAKHLLLFREKGIEMKDLTKVVLVFDAADARL